VGIADFFKEILEANAELVPWYEKYNPHGALTNEEKMFLLEYSEIEFVSDFHLIFPQEATESKKLTVKDCVVMMMSIDSEKGK